MQILPPTTTQYFFCKKSYCHFKHNIFAKNHIAISKLFCNAVIIEFDKTIISICSKFPPEDSRHKAVKIDFTVKNPALILFKFVV